MRDTHASVAPGSSGASKAPDTIAAATDDELLRRLGELLRDSRRTEADLVAHIGEVDRRRLYAREASPSMFSYCTRVLHLSGAEAYLRITAARAARVHPVLLAMLADGRLHLSGIAKLAPHLTGENCDAILGRATHRSKREIEELVAELDPRPDAPPTVRRLPGVKAGTLRAGWAGPAPRDVPGEAPPEPPRTTRGEGSGEVPGEAAGETSASAGGLRPGGVGPAGLLGAVGPVWPAVGRARAESPERQQAPTRSVVEPLAPARYRVQFTASAALREKLERLQALLRADIVDGDLGAVIDRAVTETLRRLEARRYGRTSAHTSTPPNTPLSTPTSALTSAPTGSRHVPAAVRRAVHERDGVRCRYVDEAGRRCPERHQLEYHHVHPFGMGGPHSLANVRLLCRAHNLRAAEQDYGRKVIDRHLRPILRAGAEVERGLKWHASERERGSPAGNDSARTGTLDWTRSR